VGLAPTGKRRLLTAHAKKRSFVDGMAKGLGWLLRENAGFPVAATPTFSPRELVGTSKRRRHRPVLLSIIYESVGVWTRISFARPPRSRLGEEVVEQATTKPQAAMPATSSSHGHLSALTVMR
jgi:hypothetical protein